MRKYIAPALLALITIMPVTAFAASAAPMAATSSAAEQTATGVVKFFDTTARSLELEDGSWFYLPAGFKAPADIKVGQSVTVHGKANGSAHDVVSIDIS